MGHWCLKHSEMMANQHDRSLSSTTRLDKHTQLTTGLPWHHEYPRLLVWIARGPRKCSVLPVICSTCAACEPPMQSGTYGSHASERHAWDISGARTKRICAGAKPSNKAGDIHKCNALYRPIQDMSRTHVGHYLKRVWDVSEMYVGCVRTLPWLELSCTMYSNCLP